MRFAARASRFTSNGNERRKGARLDPQEGALAGLLDHAREFDVFYIPTRYPNGLESGTPGDAFGQSQSERAREAAERIVEGARSVPRALTCRIVVLSIPRSGSHNTASREACVPSLASLSLRSSSLFLCSAVPRSPKFVVTEFEEFLDCGLLEKGACTSSVELAGSAPSGNLPTVQPIRFSSWIFLSDLRTRGCHQVVACDHSRVGLESLRSLGLRSLGQRFFTVPR
jgi:hypothetical protein